MFARHEPHIFYFELADDFFELAQAAPALLGIVGGMSQIAGKDDEIRLRAEVVHGHHGLRIGKKTSLADRAVSEFI